MKIVNCVKKTIVNEKHGKKFEALIQFFYRKDQLRPRRYHRKCPLKGLDKFISIFPALDICIPLFLLSFSLFHFFSFLFYFLLFFPRLSFSYLLLCLSTFLLTYIKMVMFPHIKNFFDLREAQPSGSLHGKFFS